MGDFLNEMAAMMCQNKPNVSLLSSVLLGNANLSRTSHKNDEID